MSDVSVITKNRGSMLCAKCGNNVDGLNFCEVCGTQVPPVDEADMTSSQQDESADSPDAAESQTAQPSVATLQPEAAQPTVAEEDSTSEASTVETMSADTAADSTLSIAEADSTFSADDAEVTPSSRTKAKIGIAAICTVLVAAAVVGILFLMGIPSPSTPINEAQFPNAVIRGALTEQVDADGDGRLSTEEASSITALVYTNDGARFLMDDVPVNVDEVVKELAAQAESDPEMAQLAAIETVMPDMDAFPNISTVVIRDANIETMDPTLIPEAKYVDLRGSKIKSLDLSKNSGLTTLFCDPEVQLSGLDEAGLYFTDLITSYKRSWDDEADTVEYDTLGRPISIMRYGVRSELFYDDQGRLVRIGDEGSSFEPTYQYGPNGLISSYSYTPLTDVTETRVTVSFGYDANGNLTQIAESDGTLKANALAYEDGRLTDSKCVYTYRSSSDNSTTTDFARYQYDEMGNVVSSFSGNMPQVEEDSNGTSYFHQAADRYSYNELGQVVSVICENSLASSATSAYKTEFTMTPEGFPSKTAVTMQGNGSSSFTYTQTYACNADGYVTSTKTEYSGSSSTGDDEISYVKMVGSLEDRPSRRFVPVLRVSIVPSAVSSVYETPVEYLQSTNCIRGDWWPFDMLLMQPQCALLSHLNIMPNYLYNPNEMKLAAYDQEHWEDGLDLSVGEQPIQDSSVREALTASAAAEIPATPASFLNDPVYGSVVEEYMGFARYMGNMSSSERENALRYGNSDSIVDRFPRAWEQYLGMLGMMSEGAFNYCFSYVDLNEDGINELAIGISDGHYPTIIAALYASDNGTPKLLAESAYRDWYSLSTSNCIVESASGGYDTLRLAAYQVEGAQLEQVGLCSYTYSDSHNRGNSDSPYGLEFQVNGGEVQNLTVTAPQLSSYSNQFNAAYPRGYCQWTCLY